MGEEYPNQNGMCIDCFADDWGELVEEYRFLVEICVILWSVDMEATSRIAFAAAPSIRGNPTAEHAGGNVCVVCSQDNVGNPRTQLRSTASQDKNAMKSVMKCLSGMKGNFHVIYRSEMRRGE